MDATPPVDIVVDDYTPLRRSLRVTIVTESYPPEVNGVATSVERVLEGLRSRGHEIQLVRPRQAKSDAASTEDAFDEVLMRGLPIPRYPHLRMGLPSKKALVDLWSRRRPDIVHIATEGPLGWSALQAALHWKLPVCSDFRTNFHAYSQHYGIGWLHRPILAYLRKFHNRTQCTMVPSDGLRRDLQACGFHNLHVVGRGVDTQRFHPSHRSDELRRSWGAGASTRVVLHVGRLAPEKNLDALVVAYEAMQRANADVRLVFVGDGPARKDLQRRCPGAVFAGMRQGDDLVAHYASGDVFLFPSLTETFGNVIPEAMASGLVVLAYDYAAAGQLIRPGENGLLARYNDTPAFVHRAAAMAHDSDEVRAMRLRAAHTAQSSSWDRIVAQVESIYLSILCSDDGLAALPATTVSGVATGMRSGVPS